MGDVEVGGSRLGAIASSIVFRLCLLHLGMVLINQIGRSYAG